jgi:hypothetical protein
MPAHAGIQGVIKRVKPWILVFTGMTERPNRNFLVQNCDEQIPYLLFYPCGSYSGSSSAPLPRKPSTLLIRHPLGNTSLPVSVAKELGLFTAEGLEEFRTKEKFMNNVSLEDGGNQIEFEDEDPAIRHATKKNVPGRACE